MSEKTVRSCASCGYKALEREWFAIDDCCPGCGHESGFTVADAPYNVERTIGEPTIKPSFNTTVAIESPYAGDVAANLEFLDECIKHCLDRSETPYASHKMLPTALNDDYPEQRKQGIEAGLSMAIRCDKRRFYVAKGWSKGMLAAREYYDEHGLDYEVKF